MLEGKGIPPKICWSFSSTISSFHPSCFVLTNDPYYFSVSSKIFSGDANTLIKCFQMNYLKKLPECVKGYECARNL
jgi:hypothetical protein